MHSSHSTAAQRAGDLGCRSSLLNQYQVHHHQPKDDYHLSALLKGLLLFFGIGLLYVLLLLSIEYFFWLGSTGRLFLFWCVFGFEAVLFYGFIFIPLAKYFKIQKGIDFETASKIVGDHFPEVKDKLLNVLQLNQQSDHTEFLLAC